MTRAELNDDTNGATNGGGVSTAPVETPVEAPPTPPEPPLPDPVRPPQKKKSDFAGVFGHKMMDTGDDILMHLARWGRADSMQPNGGSFVRGDNGMDTFLSEKPVILVLGFGWAAHSLSKVSCCSGWGGSGLHLRPCSLEC